MRRANGALLVTAAGLLSCLPLESVSAQQGMEPDAATSDAGRAALPDGGAERADAAVVEVDRPGAPPMPRERPAVVRADDAGTRLDSGGQRDAAVDAGAAAGTPASVPDALLLRPPPGPTASDSGPATGLGEPWNALEEGLSEPFGSLSVVTMMVLVVVLLFLSAIARRARDMLPERGLVPRVIMAGHLLCRLGVVVLALGLVVRVIPVFMAPAIVWALAALAIAIGWSARDVMPDLVAGAILTYEQRIRPGVFLSGPDFAGVVARRTLRATWVNDRRGHQVCVPNRLLLRRPVVSRPTTGPVHEVALRLQTGATADKIRGAIRDAVLTSPWVQPNVSPLVRRDGADPALWHVQATLIEARFIAQFEGDLLERAEDILRAYVAQVEDDWD